MSNKDRTGSHQADDVSSAKRATNESAAEKAYKAKVLAAVDDFVDTQLVTERRGFLDEARRDAIERIDRLDQNVSELFHHLESRATLALRLAVISILLLAATWVWIYMKHTG